MGEIYKKCLLNVIKKNHHQQNEYWSSYNVSLSFCTHIPGGPRGPGGPGGPGRGPLRSLSHVGEIEPLSEWGPPLRSISPWPPGGSMGPRPTVDERTKGKRTVQGKEGKREESRAIEGVHKQPEKVRDTQTGDRRRQREKGTKSSTMKHQVEDN